MPNPTTKKDLQRFLGMITYLGKFIPNLADHTEPLRKLLEKDILWSFDQPQKEAVIKLKEMITTSPVLRFYDFTLPTRVSSDASITGLGAVLEQKYENNWYPVAYGSRSLGKSEQNYCQIEREILSIVYATQKFHNYVHGTRFQVYNDHLPLKSIFQKSITKAPPRIQRFLLRRMRYDFEMYYVPGSELEVADTLSRASLSDDEPEIPEKEMNCYVHMIANEYSISESLRKKIVTETSNDATLKLLKKYIMNGWPSLRKEIEPEVRGYFLHREELTVLDNLILKGIQIVIPKSIRPEMRNLLHTGHLGIEKTRQSARTALYWPGINHEISEMVDGCEICQEYQNKQKKEPIIPHPIPSTPWFKVATDVFHLKRKDYVIVVGYCSNYFEISQMVNVEGKTVVAHTKQIFSKYGIPKEVISENGPEYKCKEYVRFAKEWDFDHNFSSPEYPESNGLAERTIQTVTRLNSRTLPELKPGESVRLYKDKLWKVKATVAEKCSQPRSYNILTEKGRTLRRNRRHIQKRTPMNLEDPDDSDYEMTREDEARRNMEDADQPNASEPDQDPEPDHEPEEEPDVLVTARAGRVIRQPAYLHDYTT